MPDANATDRAVALIRELEALRTTAPEVPAARDRLLARAFDTGLAVVAGAVLFMVANLIALGLTGSRVEGQPADDPGPAEIAVATTAFVLWLIAVVVNETGVFGHGRQTLAMRMLGIQVVDAQCPGTPGALRMAARGLTPLAATAIVLGSWRLTTSALPVAALAPLFLAVVLVLAFAFLGRNGRGPHDYLWRTRLIRPR